MLTPEDILKQVNEHLTVVATGRTHEENEKKPFKEKG